MRARADDVHDGLPVIPVSPGPEWVCRAACIFGSSMALRNSPTRPTVGKHAVTLIQLRASLIEAPVSTPCARGEWICTATGSPNSLPQPRH